MVKITNRKIRFENKAEDYSTSTDYRVQATEKRILDLIDDFCLEDIDIEFNVFVGDELKAKFTREDYLSDNVELTLKQGASICAKQVISEEITQLAKNENNEKAVNLVKFRKVELYI